jgi:hypothetical protein
MLSLRSERMCFVRPALAHGQRGVVVGASYKWYMTDASSAVLSAAVAILVVWLSQRGSSRIAAEDRSWVRRADTYEQLVRWLDEDFEALRDRSSYSPRQVPRALRLLLSTYASEPIDRRIKSYCKARSAALERPGSSRRVSLLFLHQRLVHLQLRAELGSPQRLADRVAFNLVASPLVAYLLASLVSLTVGKRTKRRLWARHPGGGGTVGE